MRPTLETSAAQVGSGALPLAELPSWALALSPLRGSAAELARRLRLQHPPVVGRLHRERLLLDLRTVRQDEVVLVAAALERAAAE